MKKKGLWTLVLILVVLSLLGSGGERSRPQYVSDWRVIIPGDFAVFEHGLLTRPLHVETWVALPVTSKDGESKSGEKGQRDFNVVRPGTQFPLDMIVSPEDIRIVNNGEALQVVQVIAW